MKSKFTILLLLVAVAVANAGNKYVNKVIVLNEGHYDYTNSIQTVPVTIGAYDPTTQVYAPFDTIWNARFATHVIIDGASIYAAADSFIIRYDLNTHQRLATATVRGVRKLAVWNSQLLVSRGEYLETFNSYFQVYDKATLGFVYELPTTAGPAFASEGIVVKNNVAYVAINNGFDWGHEVGLVGRVDLNAQAYLNEIDLGTAGKNPEAIFLDNGTIYTVNNTDYTTASISNIDVTTQTVNTTNLMTSTGCGASDFYPGNVVFQVSGESKLTRFSTSTLSIYDSLLINKSVYGIATDTINNLLYIGETDYTSTGTIHIYDLAGTLKSSFNVSVAPGNVAFDVRSSTGINENAQTQSLAVYPNPAKDQLSVYSLQLTSGSTIEIYNSIGAKVLSEQLQTSNLKPQTTTINVQDLSPGVYFLQASSNPSEKIKFVKQ